MIEFGHNAHLQCPVTAFIFFTVFRQQLLSSSRYKAHLSFYNFCFTAHFFPLVMCTHTAKALIRTLLQELVEAQGESIATCT